MDLSYLEDGIDELYALPNEFARPDELHAIGYHRDATQPSRGPMRGVPGLSRDEFDRLWKERKCFNCQETGHLARNCDKPKRGAKKSATHSSK